MRTNGGQGFPLHGLSGLVIQTAHYLDHGYPQHDERTPNQKGNAVNYERKLARPRYREHSYSNCQQYVYSEVSQ
jgi:hypothetical protein